MGSYNSYICNMEAREPAIAYGKKKYTVEEYLEYEAVSTEKHEYYQGELFAMSGALMPHNKVCGNVFGLLWNKLRGKTCQPFNSDMRVHVPRNTLFTYPDISIFCGEPESLNNDKFNLLNPVVLIEVLSDSTRDYNRNEKFRLYRDIPSLKEYVLIEPEITSVDIYRFNDQGFWDMQQYRKPDEALELLSVGESIELVEIYEGTSVLKR